MTVFMKHLPQAEFLQKFLGILANVQGNGGAVAFAGSLADFVGVAAVRDLVHWLGAGLVGQGIDFHRIGNHKGRIEA